MGISMSGVLIREDVNKQPELMENIFKRKIIKKEQGNWDYYSQFNGVNSHQIVVISNGESSGLYLGRNFEYFSDSIFMDNNVSAIPSDYLYYSFNETSMTFLFSYRKKGVLSEDYYGMDGNEFDHYGPNVLNLEDGEDISQNGLEKALIEFGLEFRGNDSKEITTYTFDQTPIKAEEKPKQPKAPENKEQGTGKNARQLIHDYSIALMKRVWYQEDNMSQISKIQKEMLLHGIAHGKLPNSKDLFQSFLTQYKKLRNDDLLITKQKIIGEIEDKTNVEENIAKLICLQYVIKTNIIEGQKPTDSKPTALIVTVIIVILFIVTMYFLRA